MADQAIVVEGLKELRKAMGQIDKQLPKNLRKRFKRIGDRLAAIVRSKVPSLSGTAASSVKSGTSGNVAFVKAGGKKGTKAAYFGWLDYGGVLRPTGGRRNTITRARVPEGRYVMPTVKALMPQTKAEAVMAFEETKRELRL